MHFISDLLNGQGSVLKQYFYFHYYDLIDQLLGRLMRRPAHDGGKITGRDTELVRIERNLTLFDYGHEIEMYTVEQGEKRDKRQ